MLQHTTTRFHTVRRRLEGHKPGSKLEAFFWELFLFAFKQAWACLFGGIILMLVLLTKKFWPVHAGLARYDFLFLAALLIQLLLLISRMETLREAKVILMFHVVGTLMELFKTHVGSWAYPEPNLFRIGGVPLFSGFMYASVGSYIARVTRILDLRYTRYPKRSLTIGLAALIYANFFTHHFLPDIRLLLFALMIVTFGPTTVYYLPYRKFRRMPLILGFFLVALFIWGAENLGTFGAIWIYPHQRNGWEPVHITKLGAWLLLMMISFVMVSLAHPPQAPPALEETQAIKEKASTGLAFPEQNVN